MAAGERWWTLTGECNLTGERERERERKAEKGVAC